MPAFPKWTYFSNKSIDLKSRLEVVLAVLLILLILPVLLILLVLAVLFVLLILPVLLILLVHGIPS